jgi:thiamine-phosphate pyrophosphorylase
MKLLLILALKIMELAVITPTDNFSNETDLINQMFEKGMLLLHLRKHTATYDELIDWLENIPTVFHRRIIIHQFPELLKEFDLGGFHLNQYHHHQTEEIKKLLTPNQLFSMSTHSFDEIKKAEGFHYFFISPVFDSISKHGLYAAFDKHEIETGLKENAPKKIFALGGVNAGNLHVLRKMGFAGAASLGNIWLSKNPVETFVEMNEKAIQIKNEIQKI